MRRRVSRRVADASDVFTVEELVLSKVLEECLEAMDRGETDLDAILDRYPGARQDIRPLLTIAEDLRAQRLPYVPPVGLLCNGPLGFQR